MDQAALAHAEKLTQDIGIPTQPRVLGELALEIAKKEPNFDAIAKLVGTDVALSGKILRLCNSPALGLRHKVDTIPRALNVLGLNGFKNVVLASSLTESMNSAYISREDFDSFCRHSLLVARMAMAAVAVLPPDIRTNVEPDHAYMAGLFHDCAIPLLSRKFRDYFQRVPAGLKFNPNITAVEEENYETNHCFPAYFVTKSWRLPLNVCVAVLNHHCEDLREIEDLAGRQLAALLMLAELTMTQNNNQATPGKGVFAGRAGVEVLTQVHQELGLNDDDQVALDEIAEEVVGTAS